MDCVGWWEGLKLGCIGAGFGRPLSQPVVRHVGLRFYFFCDIYLWLLLLFLYIYFFFFFFFLLFYSGREIIKCYVCVGVCRVGFCLGGSGLSGLLVS